MAIRCSPRTPRAAPETPCAAVRPSVRPSLPGSVRSAAAANRRARGRRLGRHQNCSKVPTSERSILVSGSPGTEVATGGPLGAIN